MVLRVNPPPFKLSKYTNQDSDGNVMLEEHAYFAVTDGMVFGFCPAGTGTDVHISVYLDETDNPAGAGDRVQADVLMTEGLFGNYSVLVAKGEYFEVTTDSTVAPTIYWRSFGVLNKPIDFN